MYLVFLWMISWSNTYTYYCISIKCHSNVIVLLLNYTPSSILTIYHNSTKYSWYVLSVFCFCIVVTFILFCCYFLLHVFCLERRLVSLNFISLSLYYFVSLFIRFLCHSTQCEISKRDSQSYISFGITQATVKIQIQLQISLFYCTTVTSYIFLN